MFGIKKVKIALAMRWGRQDVIAKSCFASFKKLLRLVHFVLLL